LLTFGCMALDAAPSGAHRFYATIAIKDLAPMEPVGLGQIGVEKPLMFFSRKRLQRSQIFIDPDA